MSEVRDRIEDTIHAAPGIHFNAIVRKLDLGPGQVQHHSRRLESMDSIISEHFWGRTHYFPSGVDVADRRAIAVVRRETAHAILCRLLEDEPMSPSDLVEDLSIARSTLEYHLDRLESVDLVTKQASNNRVQLTVADRKRAIQLSTIVDPNVIDQLTDRFERLLDDIVSSY